MPKEQMQMWVACTSCGGNFTKHMILFEKPVEVFEERNEPPSETELHRLVECMGCESIKYVVAFVDHRRFDEFGMADVQERIRHVYPEISNSRSTTRQSAIPIEDMFHEGATLIPESVRKMYFETIAAFNAGIRTLAGGGLRAVVEAICIANNIDGANLQQRIDELTKQGLLTKAQADLLHEERYLGNAALHAMATPTAHDIEDGLGIVEGLINTLYILPDKAKRIRERREAKKSGK